MNPIRVLANLCWMVPGRVGGSEEYTTRLLAAVAAGPETGVEVTVAALADTATAHPELSSFEWKRLGPSGRIRPIRVLAESSWLARESRRHDLVHHFGGRVPAIGRQASVVTIHDVQPLDLPQNFSAIKRAYLARALPRSAAVSRLVLTPSAWVAERIVDRLDLGPDRVRVVPSTYGERRADGSEGDDDTDPVGRDRGPVVVYPAMTHPHKDHATLVEAFSRLHQRRRDARLVLTGGRGRAHDDVIRLVEATPGVVHLGRVGPGRIQRLIADAAVLAFPSRYEGFGLPVLEAMRAGTPVVVADATALPEVVGAGGTLVEPGDPDAWADALLDVIDNGADEATLAAARTRVDHYSPMRARSRLLAAWADALEPD